MNLYGATCQRQKLSRVSKVSGMSKVPTYPEIASFEESINIALLSIPNSYLAHLLIPNFRQTPWEIFEGHSLPLSPFLKISSKALKESYEICEKKKQRFIFENLSSSSSRVGRELPIVWLSARRFVITPLF